ncbi:MAG TPA: rubredoxin [Novosphingobium sp.]|nr:rubredoxin [Novosphingobium sp.]
MNEPRYQRYRCTYCSMIYDEELGLPEEGLPPGTRFADIPEDWYCPQCGTEKSGFLPVED